MAPAPRRLTLAPFPNRRRARVRRRFLSFVIGVGLCIVAAAAFVRGGASPLDVPSRETMRWIILTFSIGLALAAINAPGDPIGAREWEDDDA